jgi:alpha-L-fucosidase 2
MRIQKAICFWAIGFFAVISGLAQSPLAPGRETQLWFDKPGVLKNEKGNRSEWLTAIYDAWPIGNARMGALITGGVGTELLRLNESSLWTGDKNPSGDYGKMGEYQALGDVKISFTGPDKSTQYRRSLDLAQSLSKVTYQNNGVAFDREYFASHPAGILAARLTADKPGQYSGTIELADAHGSTSSADKNGLIFSGALSNGLRYETRLMVLPQGGSITSGQGRLEFKDCDSLVLLVAAGTDYAMDSKANYRGENPHNRLVKILAAAAIHSFDELRAEHVKDYQSLAGRVVLDLGPSTPEQKNMPVDLRRLAAAKQTDPELESLLFQHGRYLMISCSRPGGLPANLQGLWNDSNTPAWSSDYHTNINVQMNYWPVEPTNLAECHLPLFDLVRSQLDDWRTSTRESKDHKTREGQPASRGWAVRTSHNTMGGMGWKWDMTANAWYALHFWEHYAFDLDQDYLRTTAYPLIKEITEYWEDHLKTLPDGRLVVPNGWSPEHGPTEDGVSYSQEIVWDLFNNYVQAADALALDREYRDKVLAMRDKLVKPGIGSWGQLLEWMTEKKDPTGKDKLDTPDDHHRHTSHLFAVYPGRQISVNTAPELAAAAKVSLLARGDVGDVREWSFAWRAALYARLLEGDKAHGQIQRFFGTTCPNLFGNHPPMQIDGNYGITAAMAEMLLQSQEGTISLLPALPRDWPNGLVKGLRARGGVTVDLEWKDGVLSAATIHMGKGPSPKVRCGSKMIELKVTPGQTTRLDGSLTVL